jgi:hypothetical protein
MGTVYAANDSKLGRQVALKFLHSAHSGPSRRARFEREARAMARVHHPNVVTVFDVGTWNDQLFAGKRATPRSDVFSFCVALHEALWGVRPFEGDLAQLAANIEAGKLVAISSHPRVPPWLRRAVLRGLRARPDERWSSMEELLAALQPRRRRKGARLVALSLTAAAAATALAVTRHRGTPANLCSSSSKHLASIWSPGRKAELAQVFAKDEQAASGAIVARNLDRYASRWIDTHRDACEASRIRGDQSDEVLSRRMLCLDQSASSSRRSSRFSSPAIPNI